MICVKLELQKCGLFKKFESEPISVENNYQCPIRILLRLLNWNLIIRFGLLNYTKDNHFILAKPGEDSARENILASKISLNFSHRSINQTILINQ